jgi:hypothetical protein
MSSGSSTAPLLTLRKKRYTLLPPSILIKPPGITNLDGAQYLRHQDLIAHNSGTPGLVPNTQSSHKSTRPVTTIPIAHHRGNTAGYSPQRRRDLLLP